MRAAVQLEDLIVEVLDAETEPRDADAANRRQLRSVSVLRLAFEGHLLGVRPRRSADNRPTSPSSCFVERNDGVPPPK